VLAKAGEFEDKAEELGEEAKEFAKDHRVPVPQMKLPFIGPVHSLVVKQVSLNASLFFLSNKIKTVTVTFKDHETALGFELSNTHHWQCQLVFFEPEIIAEHLSYMQSVMAQFEVY
jgi:hypothetical protein